MDFRKFLALRTWFHLFVGILVTASMVYVYVYNISTVKWTREMRQTLLDVLRTTQPATAIGNKTTSSHLEQATYNEDNLTNPYILLESMNLSQGEYSRDYWKNKTLLIKKLETKNVTNHAKVEIPLLTIFTTWPSKDKKYLERNNTLMDWAYFKPFVKPVFFYSNGTNISNVEKYGWDVLPVKKTAASGVPILKFMFLEVMEKYRSVFYGYANGDILFDAGLLQTLQAIATKHWTKKKPFLIIGRRTNVKGLNKLETKDIKRLARIAKLSGQLFRVDAEDYFITDPSFSWSDIPGVVIGRPAYDNWLVLNSCKRKHYVIDVTTTVVALHQTTKAGNYEGATHSHGNYNNQLLSKISKRIYYGAGSTSCALWYSFVERNTTVQVSWRKKLSKGCISQW